MVVADGDEHVIGEEDEGVSAVELLASIDDPSEEGGRGGQQRGGRGWTSVSEEVLKMEPNPRAGGRGQRS